MMKNTEVFYTRAKQFQDKRQEMTEKYEKKLKDLERFKGSKGYEDDVKKLKDEHEAALEALRREYRESFRTIFSGMVDNIERRTISAPTTDQVNLLNTLKMKKKVSEEECRRVAEAVKDNPIAVSIVTEIAHDRGIMRNYDDLCPEMSSERASRIVAGMREISEDFLSYDTTRASRMVNEHRRELYGTEIGELTKRTLFTSMEGCYQEIAGLSGESLKHFSEAVDNG